MLKTLALSLGAVLMMATAARADTLTPVDVADLRARIIAMKPTGPVELRIRNKGRILFSDTEHVQVFTKAGKTGPKINTTISEIAANRVCVAGARGWSGLCVEMFQDAAKAYMCRGEYGNGSTFEVRNCWIKIPK